MSFKAGDEVNLDHVKPRSKGGSDRPDNLQAAHVRCNTIRGDMPMSRWRVERNYLLNGVKPPAMPFDAAKIVVDPPVAPVTVKVPTAPSTSNGTVLVTLEIKQKAETVAKKTEATITSLSWRIELLERANRTIAADWKRMKQEVDEIKAALGPYAYANSSIAVAVKELRKKHGQAAERASKLEKRLEKDWGMG